MQKISLFMITILLFVQILSNGFAQIPSQSDEDSWQGPVLESGARSVGVLTDTQQQSILNNQTYTGSNDNDGDDAKGAASPAALSSRTRSAVDAAGSSSRRKGKSRVVQV
jgi:hypothetical protein